MSDLSQYGGEQRRPAKQNRSGCLCAGFGVWASGIQPALRHRLAAPGRWLFLKSPQQKCKQRDARAQPLHWVTRALCVPSGPVTTGGLLQAAWCPYLQNKRPALDGGMLLSRKPEMSLKLDLNPLPWPRPPGWLTLALQRSSL